MNRALPFAASAATAVAALALAAAPANAVTILSVGPGVSTTTFDDSIAGKHSFSDTYTFTLADAGKISGSISSTYNATLVGKKMDTQNIVFTTGKSGVEVELDGVPFTFSSNGVGVSAQGQLASEVIAAGNHTLTVVGKNFGNTISSYSGTLNFLPGVPEPGVWAMMITGLGLLGMAQRRRRSAVSVLA